MKHALCVYLYNHLKSLVCLIKLLTAKNKIGAVYML